MLTSLPREYVASVLNELVTPFASVGPEHHWMPGGFLRPCEAKLGETQGFLSPEHREKVTEWWLKVRHNANTPNWDIVSTCTIESQPGLVLIEAKAHDMELSPKGKEYTSTTNDDNHEKIGVAIQEANDALTGLLPGLALSRDSHYQLANRFAWAWKLAAMGTPVVLVYLGFLNATEMGGERRPFLSYQEWHNCMMAYTKGVVPQRAWDCPLPIGNIHLVPLIRSADFSVATAP